MALDIFKKKKQCFLCQKKMKQEYATLKYRYEGGKIGIALLCQKCSDELNKPKIEDMIDDIPL
jgi:hypothetical protein